MNATPAQISYITKLQTGWDAYLTNQAAADTSDENLYAWLTSTLKPIDREIVAWYCDRQNIDTPQPPKGRPSPLKKAAATMTEEEWQIAKAAYDAAVADLLAAATPTYVAARTATARAFAAAAQVDPATLSQDDASRVIDTLK